MAIGKTPGGVEDLTFGMETEQQQRQFGLTTITQINARHLPFSASVSVAQELIRLRAVEEAIRRDLDLKAYIIDVYLRDSYIVLSSGAVDAGKPVVTDSSGRLSNSLLGSGNYAVGPFTPVDGDEYPDSTGHNPGAWWYLTGVPEEGYEFTTGDLIGQTAINGTGLFLGQEEWFMNEAIIDPSYYYLLDGSNPITAPFQGGGQQFKDAIGGTEAGDLIEFNQLLLVLDALQLEFVNVTGDIMTGQLKGINPLDEEDLTRRDFVEALVEAVKEYTDNQLIDTNERIDAVDERIDAVDDRLDGIDATIDQLAEDLRYPESPIISPMLVNEGQMGLEYVFNIINFGAGLTYRVDSDWDISYRVVDETIIVTVEPYENVEQQMVIPLLFTARDDATLSSEPTIARFRLHHPGIVDVMYVNNDFGSNFMYQEGLTDDATMYRNDNFSANEFDSTGFGRLNIYANSNLFDNRWFTDGMGVNLQYVNNDFEANSFAQVGFGNVLVYVNNDFEANEAFSVNINY